MKRALTGALVAGALLLAGCGTTDTEADQDSPSTPQAADCDPGTTETGPVELTDGFGRKVTLDKPAERVAVLEWQQLEDVLSLCITPVAAADLKGYSTWTSAEELPESGITETGTRGEPNTEALYGASPDLVIVEAYTADDEIIKTLEKFDVPVLATKGADAKDPIAQTRATFELIAQATGRTERAAEVLAEMDETLAEAKAEISEADLAEKDFVYFDGWIDGGNVSIRPFGQGSLMGEVGEALGLTNAWTGEVDAAYGLGQSDIEGFTKTGGATLLYTGTDDPDSEDVNQKLVANPVWKKLPAVQDGRAHAFPAGIWTFGGPRSVEQIAEAYVDALAD